MNLRKPTPPGLPLSGEELSFPPDKGGPRGVGFKMLQRSGSGSAIQLYPAGETRPTKKHFVLEMELDIHEYLLERDVKLKGVEGVRLLHESLMNPASSEQQATALPARPASKAYHATTTIGTTADYIVVEMAKHLLGENWLPDYVAKANIGGIERVLL